MSVYMYVSLLPTIMSKHPVKALKKHPSLTYVIMKGRTKASTPLDPWFQ